MSVNKNWLVTVHNKTTRTFWCEDEDEALNLARDYSLDDSEAQVEVWQRFGSVTTIKTVTLTLPNDRKRELKGE